MEVRVLGELRWVGAAGPVRLPSRRGRDLLAALVLRRAQTVPSGELLDLVWGDAALTLDTSAVHTVVARLRRLLGSGAIARDDVGYRLGQGVTVDDAEFLAAVRKGATELGHGRAAEAVTAYRRGIELWTGDLAYAGVSDHLVSDERLRLDEAHARAGEDLAWALLTVGGHTEADEAGAVALAVTTAHPLREVAHEARLLALHRLGRRSEALAGYAALARSLRDELGIRPGPRLQHLHEALLSDDTSRIMAPLNGSRERLAAGPTSPHTAPQRRAALPRPPAPASPIIGRDADVDAVRAALAVRRVVTLTGPGGVGKTRLLLEVAGARDRTWFTSLAGVTATTADEVAEHLLAERDGSEAAGGTSAPTSVGRLEWSLDDTGARLLAIDEVDESRAGVGELVTRLVAALPRLAVILTSRRALEVTAERVVPVAPLETRSIDTRVREPAAAVLLRERLTDRGIEVPEADSGVLASTARLVDGLPLAIELVAARATSVPLDHLPALLSDPLDLASVDVDGVDDADDTGPGRHRSLRSTIQWSVARLDSADRAALRALGVMAGPFDVAAAAGVLGVSPRAAAESLHRLARDGLLVVARPAQELPYRMLVAVRALALEGLESRGLGADARGAHRAWHARRWRGAPRGDALLADVRTRRLDYLEALATALDDGDRTHVGDLAITLGRLWLWSDDAGPGLRWQERVLASGLVGPSERARVLCQHASLCLHRHPDVLRASLAEALPLLDVPGEEAWLTNALTLQAFQHVDDGDLDRAVDVARTAVEPARRGRADRHADALSVLALVAALAGHTSEAETAVRAAWFASADGSGGIARQAVGSNLAEAMLALGRPEEAQRLLDAVRVPDDEPPFLVASRAWARLALGDAGGAGDLVLGVADVFGPVPATMRTLEVLSGAAGALRVGNHAGATEALALAEHLAHDLGTQLAEWQRLLVHGGTSATVRPQRPPLLGHADATARDLHALVLGLRRSRTA